MRELAYFESSAISLICAPPVAIKLNQRSRVSKSDSHILSPQPKGGVYTAYIYNRPKPMYGHTFTDTVGNCQIRICLYGIFPFVRFGQP